MKSSLVILGMGYSGLMTAIKLEEKIKNRDDIEIVIVDRNSYHQYVHLACEIVTDVKKVSDVTLPAAELLKNRKIRFIQATVTEIDFPNKVVKTNKGNIPYCELVIALGTEPNYCHIKGAEEYSMQFNSVESAAKIRDKLKEITSKVKNPTVVVGGGGFTGVELAGEIADELKGCVTIVECSDSLLPSWHNQEFSEKVAEVLIEMGAKLFCGKLIVEVKPDRIVLNDGTQIESSLFIWTAGVQGSTIASRSGLKTGKGNRIVITEFCEVADFHGVYAVGDSSLAVDSATGEVLPQCIEIALQQAEVVAKNLAADVNGTQRTAYVSKFNGLILAVGEKYGIGKIFGVELEGRVAQLIKRIIHLQYVYEIAGLKEAFKETL